MICDIDFYAKNLYINNMGRLWGSSRFMSPEEFQTGALIDEVSWLKPPDNQKYRKLECSKFTHQLFDLWEWDKELHYRTNGRLVKADKKLMLLFDFTKPEVWRGLKMVSDFE